jgi:hypothetical protein
MIGESLGACGMITGRNTYCTGRIICDRVDGPLAEGLCNRCGNIQALPVTRPTVRAPQGDVDDLADYRQASAGLPF